MSSMTRAQVDRLARQGPEVLFLGVLLVAQQLTTLAGPVVGEWTAAVAGAVMWWTVGRHLRAVPSAAYLEHAAT